MIIWQLAPLFWLGIKTGARLGGYRMAAAGFAWAAAGGTSAARRFWPRAVHFFHHTKKGLFSQRARRQKNCTQGDGVVTSGGFCGIIRKVAGKHPRRQPGWRGKAVRASASKKIPGTFAADRAPAFALGNR
ncbi:MAG: hypothetical protein PUI40_03995 [Oscillospiraceae bacterium]|nr:hypothetical protein [Oscillospiraceae bacterium]MDD7041107.1 hypothetical protein [Oscillospiraceae bacterium]MDY2611212.1 hypothetical protein [Oscillospiraceae bacterium]